MNIQPNLYTGSQWNQASNSMIIPGSSNKKPLNKTKENYHQEFYYSRFMKLTSIFINEGHKLDSHISEDGLLTILDSLGKEMFDREIAEHLFEKIPFEEDSHASDERYFVLKDFIETYIKAEYLLILQEQEIKAELSEIYQQIETIKTEYKTTLQDSELSNQTNCLQIDVIEAVCDEDLYEAEIGSSFNVVLIIDGYKYETEEITIETTNFNPIFNRSFHLRLKNPDEKLQILLRDQSRYVNDPSYSDLKCTISLGNYKDQVSHVTWLEMYNFMGEPTRFKVNLVIQWQPSKIAHYEEKLDELGVLEEKARNEKEFVEESLKVLGRIYDYNSSIFRNGDFSKPMRHEIDAK